MPRTHRILEKFKRHPFFRETLSKGSYGPFTKYDAMSFLYKVRVGAKDDCWDVWLAGQKGGNRYNDHYWGGHNLWMSKEQRSSHRASSRLMYAFVHDISLKDLDDPEKFFRVYHTCGNRLCVNPSHLIAVPCEKTIDYRKKKVHRISMSLTGEHRIINDEPPVLNLLKAVA